MKDTLRPGLISEIAITVTNKEAAPHVPVFSTPSLLALFEATSAQAIDDHLAAGTTTVGFEVNMRHLGPAPIGARVVATAEVSEIRGTRIYLTLIAHCDGKKIGDGTHSRVIVPATFGAK